MSLRNLLLPSLLLAAFAIASPAAAVVDFSGFGSITDRLMDKDDAPEPGRVVFHLGALEVATLSLEDFLDDPDIVTKQDKHDAYRRFQLSSGVVFDRATIDVSGTGGVGDTTPAVPEPSAALVFSLGIVLVGARLGRR